VKHAGQRAPLSYTPPDLTKKILDALPRLEGERKQVTVLFADIKDSTELIRDLDPEATQQLLDPCGRYGRVPGCGAWPPAAPQGRAAGGRRAGARAKRRRRGGEKGLVE
jgi:hypothetical protein